MHHRFLASVSVAAVLAGVVFLPAAPALAQTDLRTGWGDPDLQGIWDFRTITPLERPEAFGDQAFLTAEEAANLEQEVVDRNSELANRAARRTTVTESVDRGEDGAPGFYNNFWLDRGTRTVGTRRTSLVVDPPNGRLPEMSGGGPGAHGGRGARTGAIIRPTPGSIAAPTIAASSASTPVRRSPPGGYNQNLQVFQTPDEVVLVTEMVHNRAGSAARRPAGAAGPRAPVVGRLARALGRRHPGDRDEELQRPARLAGHDPRHDPGRAVDTGRRGHAGVHLHGHRSADLDASVDRVHPDAAERPAAVRVRLPRGELQHARDPGRSSGGGSGGCRSRRRAAGRLGAAVPRPPGHRQPLRRRHLRPGRVPGHLGRGALPDQHRPGGLDSADPRQHRVARVSARGREGAAADAGALGSHRRPGPDQGGGRGRDVGDGRGRAGARGRRVQRSALRRPAVVPAGVGRPRHRGRRGCCNWATRA